MVKTLLIANRGEIACRIMATAKAMGIVCVAVYSDIDSTAKHVQMSDKAYYLGPAPSQESYLCQDKLIDLALAHHIEAIHPGYGFLSENASFAKRCEQAGIIFVGPSAKAIELMGSKAQARDLARSINVPVVPGYQGQDQSYPALLAAAKAMGFPVLIKASHGGGGKGMRIVYQEADFQDNLDAVKREAKASFDQDAVLLEKYLIDPRHIEVQIVADQKGNVLHLFNRDCSMQRRQQKIIEEAPAPGLSESLAEQMGNIACDIAKAVDYVGVGTIEFLLETNGAFYFMEMNTRLQVEHAVTEMITGIDLVKWQLDIASGQALPIKQSLIKSQGHAIEVRICAEDPIQGFLPATGKIQYLNTPKPGKTLRLDTGVCQGDTVSPYYDPMLAKLVSLAPTREAAILQLTQALSAYQLIGISHNMYFLRNILCSEPFVKARLSTQYVEQSLQALLPVQQPLTWPTLAMAVLGHYLNQQHHRQAELDSPWQRLSGFRLVGDAGYRVCFEHESVRKTICVNSTSQGMALTCLDEKTWQPIVVKEFDYQADTSCLSLVIDKEKYQARLVNIGLDYWVITQERQTCLRLIDGRASQKDSRPGAGAITAPMPGVVVLLHVNVGDRVKAHTPLLVLEAMKMEHVIKAPADGVVTEIYCSVADQIRLGSELIKLA